MLVHDSLLDHRVLVPDSILDQGGLVPNKLLGSKCWSWQFFEQKVFVSDSILDIDMDMDMEC